jgi:hypothetical protein
VDLLAIARRIWRYKLATVPVIVLTFFAAVYVVAVKKPVYEASSSYILINPPPPPTAEEIARDPALGRVNADNPYTRFSDPSVIIEVLASALQSASAQRALLRAGADGPYTVARTSEFGYSSPIMAITAQGSSPQGAIRTAKLVGDAVTRELDRMQESRGVAPRYLIRAQQVNAPDHAQLKASGQLRVLVGVLAFGAVLLFVLVSVADAITALRRERSERATLSGPDDEPWSDDEDAGDGGPGLEAEYWPEIEGSPLGAESSELFPDAEVTAPTNGGQARRMPYRPKR